MIVEELEVRTRYLSVRSRTEQICSPLSAEDHVVQPIVDVSPPKWHLGHTTWFFETFILDPNLSGYKKFNDRYNFLFNSYYETIGSRVIRTDRGNLTRPTVAEILAYRKYVDEKMIEFMQGDISADIMNLLELGLQHEQQHQELLYYDIKYILGNNPLFPAYIDKSSEKKDSQLAVSSFIEIDEGIYNIGFEGAGFSFDNEHAHHRAFLHSYRISDRLITNGEFLEFVIDGGYEDFRFWLSEGWDWVNSDKVKAPLYWHEQDGSWHQYSLNGGLKGLDQNAPVSHISFFEADAFAKWSNKRLPTEFEWEVAANQVGAVSEVSNFMEMEAYEPVPGKNGQNQFFGDTWEWTNSAYLPYPYYKAPDGAVGEYNGKFMINQMVLRGGSYATPKAHIRNTYRNFFHPHLRWMTSGIRLAQNL